MFKKIVEAQSVSERIESRLRAAEKLNKPWANVEAVRTRPEGPSYLLKERFFGANIVTTAGDTYYAERAAGQTPTNAFQGTNGRLILRTGSVTPAKGDTYTQVTGPISNSNKTWVSGYPKQNDDDADNTATNKTRKVTWTVSYTTGDFNSTGILGGAIHAAGGSPGGALLTHFNFAASFDKTSSDTLKVIVNHDFLGA
jgi:hypothetical protein